MRRIAASIVVTAAVALAAPGVAHAGCAESIGLLESQVDLIATAGPLAADRTAPLGPGRDRLITIAKPELSARTEAAFDVLGAVPSATGGKDFAGALSSARGALDEARTAHQRGDDSACEEAIALGLDAAREARAAFN